MDIAQLCSILDACISPNQQQRAAAEQTLKQFQHTRGQLVNLLRISVEPSVSQEIRQSAAIAFKNLVKGSWSPTDDSPSPIPDEDKLSVRGNLLEGIIRAHPVVRSQLGECFKSIIYVDYPQDWPDLLQSILQSMNTQEQGRIYGCLLGLRLLARKYEFRSPDEVEALEEITEATFPTLLQIIQQLQASNSISVEAGELCKLVLKTFWSSTYLGVPKVLLQESQFTGWMTVFHNFLSKPVPQVGKFFEIVNVLALVQEGQPQDEHERKSWTWWKVNKWALNIVYHLFSRYGSSRQHTKGSNEFQFHERWQLCSTQFLEDHMAIAIRLIQGEYVSPRATNLMLRYLTHAIELSHTWKLIKPHIHDLLTKCVFDLMCFDDNDAELWEEDPQEYIRKGYDLIEDMYSAKTAAMNLVSELCKQRTKSSLDPFMHFIVQVMTEYQTAAASGTETDRHARRMDGAFLAIGCLEDILKRKETYRKQLEPMLQQFVVPAFSSRFGHLRAKACWVTGRFADIDFKDGTGYGPTFLSLFELTIKALQDPDVPVRVDAVIALRNVTDAYSEEHLSTMKPLLPRLLNDLFKLMSEVDNEDLVATLETIVEKFGEDMAPYATVICQHLTDKFWRIKAEDADNERDEDEGSLAAFGCLGALSTVLESVSSLPYLFPTLEPVVFPILQRLCTQEGQDVYEEVMEILSFFTFFSPEISQRLWSLWPLIYQAYNDWACDYFENILVPLDNFISRGTEVFLSSRDPNYLEQAIHIAQKALTEEDFSEGDVICAPKLLEVILQNCRGRVDQCVNHFISLALGRLSSAKGTNLKDQLVNLVANAVYYNPSLALQSLSQQGRLDSFLNTWFQMIFTQRKDGRRRHFRRQHDKKVSSLALSTLLVTPDEVLPRQLQAGMGQVTAGCLKLLQDLKKQQDSFEAADGDSEAEESDDDTDVGEEEDEDEEDPNEAEDEAYMKRLSREAAKMSGLNDQTDSDDEWTDDEMEATALDDTDPYIVFAEALTTVQASLPQRSAMCTAMMDESNKSALHSLLQYAEQKRLGALQGNSTEKNQKRS